MRNLSSKAIYIVIISLIVSISIDARQPLDDNLFISDEVSSSATLNMYSPAGNPVPMKGNVNQLNNFLDELAKSGTKKIRVGHFGDSLIWGDIITEDIRDLLQAKYGGQGLGFVSICNDDMMVRQDIDHKFSDDWDWGSVFTKNSNRYPLGMNGIASTPKENSWVSYEVSDRALFFDELTLLYKGTNASSVVIIESGDGRQEFNIPSTNKGMEEFKHKFNSLQGSIKLTFRNCTGSFIYGVNLESGNGVYVDNFAMRGNSGISLKSLDTNVLKQANADMNYKLFILNFGINAVEAGKTDHTFYKKMMVKIIESYKKKFPNASFIVMSAGDRAIKKGSQLVSDSFVPILVQAQEELAEEAGVAFWNLYEAMGGEGSMVEWVKNGLAAKDYIHLNADGGRAIAELFVNALLNQN